MRWSVWPVSICVHVVLAIAVFIVPLTADVEWPAPAPLHPLAATMKVVPVPEPIAAIATAVPAPRVLPNVVAPVALAPARDVAVLPGPVVPGIPDGSGPIDPAMLGPVDRIGPVAPVGPRPEPAVAPPPILRAGQGVREPKRVSGAMPEYPPIARSARVQGVVLLEAVIDERGRVGSIRVLKSVPLLDAAAVAAVAEWRYTPTLLNGVPVSVLLTITINFTLQ